MGEFLFGVSRLRCILIIECVEIIEVWWNLFKSFKGNSWRSIWLSEMIFEYLGRMYVDEKGKFVVV